MIFREAILSNIPQLQIVRNAVKENVLSNPSLVTNEDYIKHLTVDGKGWICEADDKLVGFAIINLKQANVWALFLLPEYEGKGIGKTLHQTMLDWYFSQTNKTVWLSTGLHTRAEKFYIKQGWQPVGLYGTKEIKFEMTAEKWSRRENIRI